MKKETRIKLWNDFFDLVEKYQAEDSYTLFALLTLFSLKMGFDCSPTKESVLEALEKSKDVAWDWHLKQKELDKEGKNV